MKIICKIRPTHEQKIKLGTYERAYLCIYILFLFSFARTLIEVQAWTILSFLIWNCKLLQIIMILFIYHFLQTTTINSNGKLETMRLQIRKWHRYLYDECKLFYSLMICVSSYISSIFRPWKSNQTFTLVLRNFAHT